MSEHRKQTFIGLVAAIMVIGMTMPVAQARQVTETLVGDMERGERLYRQRCMACHALDANRAGPSHRGVFGREAGAVDGYRYSGALRDSGIIWTAETLDSWLSNPTGLVPGTSMGVRTRNAQDRADIISYLESLSPAEPD
ncbi:MAG: cytochrome c [Hyphobacterium sp.]|nr:MAG: cytochrome c [Hyphobacterium sp.]